MGDFLSQIRIYKIPKFIGRFANIYRWNDRHDESRMTTSPNDRNKSKMTETSSKQKDKSRKESIVKPESPKRNDIHICMLDIILDDMGILNILDLLAGLTFAAHLKSMSVHNKI